MDASPAPHFEALLQRDIDVIRNRLLEMLRLDEEALKRAFDAVLSRDRQLAYSVILRDQEVDSRETELDRLCIEFIMRHQPVASHLRFVYGASKVISQLERVGDYAESIARQALLLSSVSYEVPREMYSEIAKLAVSMLHNAVRAFVDKNPDLARATMLSEPRVNQVRDRIIVEVLQWREQGILPLDALAPMMTVARRFERVSDQATNVCEEALYFATGEYMRHFPSGGFRVVFVDETHGCLSRMAELIGNRLGAERFSFSSAGVEAGTLDPQTVWFLAEKGFDASHEKSLSIEQIPQLEHVQMVILLSKEAEAVIPRAPSKALNVRWLVADPTRVHGTPDEIRAAYEHAFEALTTHIRDLIQAVLGNHGNPSDENTNSTI